MGILHDEFGLVVAVRQRVLAARARCIEFAGTVAGPSESFESRRQNMEITARMLGKVLSCLITISIVVHQGFVGAVGGQSPGT